VRVRSIDKAGHIGAWTAPRLVIVPRDNGSARVAYEGAWQSATTSGTYLGSVHVTSDPAAALQTSATADRLAVIGTRAPDAARFSIYVDGLLVATVDPVADSVQQRVVLWSQNVARGAHTVRIEVEGDPGVPALMADAGSSASARIDAIALAVTS
jgi:hypothetical protein